MPIEQKKPAEYQKIDTQYWTWKKPVLDTETDITRLVTPKAGRGRHELNFINRFNNRDEALEGLTMLGVLDKAKHEKWVCVRYVASEIDNPFV